MQEIATGYGLIEGPVWDPAKGLYFSDVINGGVFLLDRSDQITQVIPKRRGVGGMALADCGPISGIENGYASAPDGTLEGAVANYWCMERFNLVGDATRTCQSDGEWSGEQPSCAACV